MLCNVTLPSTGPDTSPDDDTGPDDDVVEGRFQSPETRRRQILDAAARLAVEDGLDNTSIAKVAATAGLAKGSIYLHYRSRNDLLAALQADLWQQMLEEPTRVVADPQMSWADKLDAVVEHWMRFEFERRDLYHAVFHTVATESDEPLDQASGLMATLLDGGITAGEFDLGTLDRAVVLQFLLHGYLGPCFHNTEPEEAIADVQLLFRRVVGVER